MKRIVALLAAALLVQAVFADDADEPSEQSVLEAARAKYWQDQQSSNDDKGADISVDIDIDVNGGDDGQSDDTREYRKSDDGVPFTPFLISFVPGLSAPFGYFDVGFAAGAVGNMTRDVKGAEGAGVFNMSRNVMGFQGAGVFNMAEDVRGFQGAGVFNMAKKVHGFQGAGVFNMADDVDSPFQAAGVFNMAKKVRGFQGAGVFNIADEVSGGQMAGVFNVAEKVRGVQIGLVNVAEEIDGIQVGLVNIAGNGVDSLGVLYEPASDWFYAQWQSGTPALFSVLGIGAPGAAWFEDWDEFAVFAGLGTRSRFLGVNLDFDVCAVQSVAAMPSSREAWESGEAWKSVAPYPSVRLTAGIPVFGKRGQIVGGLKADVDVDSLGDRVPESLRTGDSWSDTWFGERFTVWPKWYFGLKF
jgi:hypothetical protein